MPLTRLIYFSENQTDPAAGSIVRTLSSILSASNRNNKVQGLTGALIFDNQWFLQVLEGERNQVWHSFERIKADERHSGVVVAEVVDADQRVFSNWWMGLAMRNSTTEHLFTPASKDGGGLDPRTMSAAQMLQLMIELSRLGLSRGLAKTQAA